MGLTRFPVYHTLLHGRGEAALDRVFARCAAEGPLSYAMHAIDVLGLREDSLDGRLARHPGMASSLTEKLAFADRVFAAIRRHFDALPFRERLDSVPVSA
jgi:hypothetical protein